MSRACLNLFLRMNKADFVRRVVEQFNGIASAAMRQAEAEIEKADQRLTFDPFCAWLERRRARAKRYPFSRDLKPASTPSKAARAFADVIALDAESETDWAEHWERAAPILANRQPETSDGWRYGHYLRDYIAAVRGHACASAFDRRLSKGEELVKKVIRGEIAGGKEYQSTWMYWKGILKDSDLTEARYLEAEIDETEVRIRRLESGADKELLRLQREKLRTFKRRLEALEKRPAANTLPMPQNFAEMFKTADGENQAIAALVKMELIHADTSGRYQWKDSSRTTGAILAVLEALHDAELIHQVKITPGCKLIAKRFGVKVVKNYPKARFTDTLRREIKWYLDNNRDNNRDGI